MPVDSGPSAMSTSRSTTAHCSSSLAHPAAGRRRCCAWLPASRRPRPVRWSSTELSSTTSARASATIALASQSYALYPHMSVAENIGFPLRVDGFHRRRIEEHVSQVARLLQLDDVLDRTPRQLSGGQQQRTAIGRAIVRDPRLLLLDEPMSNLDAKLRAQTGHVITQLHRRLGLTTLMVTHDHNEAMAMGDQLAVMRNGQIVQSGRPIDVYDAPANIFVAQFMGTMTVVEATVSDSRRSSGPSCRISRRAARPGSARPPPFASVRLGAGWSDSDCVLTPSVETPPARWRSTW